MSTRTRAIASAFVGGLVLLGAASTGYGQTGQPQTAGRVASLTPGSILGIVQDERGAPIIGAIVSALGASTAFATTDRFGRFEMRTLSPGPYLVRAHLTGYLASHGQIVDVRASSRSSSSIALRRSATAAASSYPVLNAGVAGASDAAAPEPGEADATGTSGSLPNDDHGEIAWRIRHARRGILKDTVPTEVFGDGGAPGEGGNGFGPSVFGRAVDSSTRVAANFFTDTPFSGQFNFFTTSSFETPQQLFSTDSFARSVAYVSLSAPAGDRADWNVRGAMTQGDISSWIIAGEYLMHASERHRYDIGLSYATQRYGGGNPAAIDVVADGNRNAGTLYGFDTFAVTPAIAITYGARYSRYDYLESRSLLSPRVALTISPSQHLRFSTIVSDRASAPGAEEFLPPTDGGILLPPQRTFSSLNLETPLQAERTFHAEANVERDIAGSTISLRVFQQRVSDQLMTLFGVDVPGQPAAELGHYLLGNVGDVQATGFGAGFRTAFGDHVHGSVEYSETSARWQPTTGDVAYLILFSPAALSLESQRIHDVTTAVDGVVPGTLTKVTVLYRVSNAFARPLSGATAATDSRFDVQVRQSLPFMDFSSAKWEMLVAVRNFFRDGAADQSVYDELLVVRPPKRIVGGLTLHF